MSQFLFVLFFVNCKLFFGLLKKIIIAVLSANELECISQIAAFKETKSATMNIF